MPPGSGLAFSQIDSFKRLKIQFAEGEKALK